MTKKRRLPHYISRIERAWLKLGTRDVLYSDLARAAGATVRELNEINRMDGGFHGNGWDVSEVTAPRATAGDRLWAYLQSLRQDFDISGI